MASDSVAIAKISNVSALKVAAQFRCCYDVALATIQQRGVPTTCPTALKAFTTILRCNGQDRRELVRDSELDDSLKGASDWIAKRSANAT